MYLFTVVADKPLALWPLSDTSPYDDFSGYNRAASLVAGTATRPASLVSQIGNSTLFSNASQGTFDSPVFLRGREHQSFVLEAWVLPITSDSAEQAILSHAGTYDGLTRIGNSVSFTTKYATTGECRVTHNLVRTQAAHIVGIHTEQKNTLYVNGELVGETEITDAQYADVYLHSTTALLSGESTGAGTQALNCVALYTGVLTETMVQKHFAAGRAVQPATEIAEFYDSQRVPLSASEAAVFLETQYSTDLDWSTGVITDVTIMNDVMIPTEDEAGVSLPGNWLTSFAIDTADTLIYSVQIDWVGSGAVVEASLDSVTWETAVRGKPLALIPNGFDPTGKELDIRVSFPGGMSNDTAYISQLLVTGYSTNPLPNVDDRVFTVTPPVSFGRDLEPVQYREDNGARLYGGTISIGADTSTAPMNPSTVEFWLRKNTAATPTLSVTGTVYVNGELSSLADLRTNEWSLVHVVSATPVTTAISMSGEINVAQVVLYEPALTAAQSLEIYQNYTGKTTLVPNTVSSLAISKPAQAAVIYAHDWQITGGGA